MKSFVMAARLSEVQPLAGRNCRLADGTSRNPGDRNAIIEQRTKDLEGLAGQGRRFDLESCLSDGEETGIPVRWSIGEGTIPHLNEKDKILDLPKSDPSKVKVYQKKEYKDPTTKQVVSFGVTEVVCDVRRHDPGLPKKDGRKSGVYALDELPLYYPFAKGKVEAERWMTCAGASPNLSVLFVPDYTSSSESDFRRC